MKEFILNTELEEIELQDSDELSFLKGLTRNYRLSEEDKEKYRSYLHGDVFHKNYLYYLSECYNTHRGYVINPDILWNLVLTEIAGIVKDDPEQYRFLFTDSDEKKEIIIAGFDPFELDMNEIVKCLKALVPSNVETFIPEFTTTGEAEIHAHNCAFADMVSPYYNYSMYLCGFPKVRVEGTQEDWEKFMNHIDGLGEIMEFDFITEYLVKVADNIEQILDSVKGEDRSEFFTNIFSLERCGSGSQVEVNGWITDFYVNQPQVPYLENFSAGYSKVDYTVINVGEYCLFSGLFCSEDINGYLIPIFSRIACVEELVGELQKA